MKKILAICIMVAALCGCNAHKQTSTAEKETQTLSLEGKWRLLDYAGEKEMVTVDASAEYVLLFLAEKIFGMQTDCNSLGGAYQTTEEKLSFENIACTEMLCPDMVVEEAMKRIFPLVTSYAISSDAVLTLKGDGKVLAHFSFIEN